MPGEGFIEDWCSIMEAVYCRKRNLGFTYVRRSPKTAFVIDELLERGGASKVLLSLMRAYPGSDVYTALRNKERFPEIDSERVIESFLKKMPGRTFWSRHYLPLSPLAFEQFDFTPYDLVISLSAGAAKGVITTTETLHVSIVLTPMRYQWDGRGGGIPLLTPVLDSYLRVWDREASLRPDVLVTISKYIQERVKKVYGRDSTVVYPGIDLTFWKPSSVKERDNFYLVVSRLRDYKRIDLAIQACECLNKKLVIIGDGPERSKLATLSGPNTKLLGYLQDEEVRAYMQKCRAFLFPGVEDFGLAPLEAMACGAPVIAFDGGGFPEVLEDGDSGVLFNEQTGEGLSDALARFEHMNWESTAIVKRARQFDENEFVSQFRKIVNASGKK